MKILEDLIHDAKAFTNRKTEIGDYKHPIFVVTVIDTLWIGLSVLLLFASIKYFLPES